MPLPNAEPIGLPAPVWLLQFLLVLTFSLHLIPMAFTVGGSLVAGYAEAAFRVRGDARYQWLARRMGSLLLPVTSFTITLGVAPLLFVQLVYGKFFYPASVLTGWTWFAVVPLLLVGYSLLYLQAWTGEGRWRPWAGLVALLCFVGVAAIYVSTMGLTTQVGVWKAMYAETQAGTHWFLRMPRLLHVLTGAVAMAGALVLLVAHHVADAGLRAFARRFGLVWLSAGLVLAIGAAFWFRTTLAVAPATWLMAGVGVAAGLGYGLFAVAERAGRAPLLAWLGMASLSAGAVLLGVQRHLTREAMLAPFVNAAADWKLQPQWDVFAIFAVLLVGTLGLVGYLVARFFREARAEESHLARSAD